MGQVEDLDRIQRAAEKELEATLEALFARTMREIADMFAVTGNPNPPDDLGHDIGDALRAHWEKVARQSADVVAREFKADLPLEVKADAATLFDRIVQEFIEQYGARDVVNIVKATRDQMIRLIGKGLRDGKPVQAIAEMMREAIPTLSKLRAVTIARTETHSASMFASQQVAKETRLPLMKEWVAVEDHRTRDFGEGDGDVDEYSHRAMSGVQVPIDGFYLVPRRDGTSEAMRYPGDPNGSAGNVINCRCAQVYKRAR